MKNILITDYRGENVMVYTTVSLDTLKQSLDATGEEYSDIFEVPEEEIQFYVYEPLWLDEKTEEKLNNSILQESFA